MSAASWRISLIVQGYDLRNGHAVPVVVGLIETTAGGVQLALRISDPGRTVILPVQAGSQLIANLREALAERLKITGERLGSDKP